MKRFSFVIFFLIFVLLAPQIKASEDAYKEMISAIDNWLKSNPITSFSSPEEEQSFKWRVEIEKVSSRKDIDKFTYFSKLLGEIDDKEFIYKKVIYNNHSIRVFMMENYPYSDRTKDIPSPDSFFLEMYNWYKENITSKREQAYWLKTFMEFLSDFSSSDAVLFTSCYEEIQEILKQYLVIMEYYLNNEYDNIEGIKKVYQQPEEVSGPSIIISFGGEFIPEEYFLDPLLKLSDSDVGKLIKEEDRKMVIRYITSNLATFEETVKIYINWGE